MATVNAVVLKHHKKQDGTWNVKICVNHKSKPRYIETASFVDRSQLDSKGRLKKIYIDKRFSSLLTEYRERISLLGNRVDQMTSNDLREFLIHSNVSSGQIDFFKELEDKVIRLKNEGKVSQSYIFKSLLNHLKSFVGKESFDPNDITVKFLTNFEDFLKKGKVFQVKTRSGSLKKPFISEGVSTNGIINYMSYFKSFFNKLRKKYNDPGCDTFPIPSNPFEYYELPKPTPRKKRNLPLRNLAIIAKYKPIGFMEEISRDLFMLSFYLCGMNPKDMFVYLNTPTVGKTLEYGRSKIKNSRRDGGITNVLINEEAMMIIQKYGGDIQKRYNNHLGLNRVLYKGWKSISEKIGFKCTMYYARHSFGNIARQICKFSKDDVSFALNHKFGSDITDVYIEPDWSVVHKVQMKVIEEFRKELDRV